MSILTDNQVSILIWWQSQPSGWYTARDIKLDIEARVLGQALRGLYRRGVINRRPGKGRVPASYKLLACSRWLGLTMTKGRCIQDAPRERWFRAGELTHIAPPTALGPALLALANVDKLMAWEWRGRNHTKVRWYRLTPAGRDRQLELKKVESAWRAAGL